MTRPQIKLYWHYLNKRKFKELERYAILLGYDPKKKQKSHQLRERAIRWQEDPLFGFPNDIIYLTRAEIEQKLAISRRFGSRVRPEARWDRERAEACIGRRGPVARRCSMNDRLWEIFRQSIKSGAPLGLKDVKRMIMIDIKRSKLYPPGWRDDRSNPPQWHLDKLRAEGRLDQILREIEEAARA